MKVKVRQLFMMDEMAYDYKRVFLYKEDETKLKKEEQNERS